MGLRDDDVEEIMHLILNMGFAVEKRAMGYKHKDVHKMLENIQRKIKDLSDGEDSDFMISLKMENQVLRQFLKESRQYNAELSTILRLRNKQIEELKSGKTLESGRD